MAGSTSTIAKSASIKQKTIIEDPIHVGAGCAVMADRIGRYCFINNNTCIYDGVRIGRFVTFARNCQIGGAEHPIHYLSTGFFRISRHWFPDDHVAQTAELVPLTRVPNRSRGANIEIGNDVWFGASCLVLKGVTIGSGAVIGAGAVVTKDVPPYAIVAGNPAKVVKYRFDEETVARLMAAKWWDRDMAVIEKLPLNDVQESLRILESVP